MIRQVYNSISISDLTTRTMGALTLTTVINKLYLNVIWKFTKEIGKLGNKKQFNDAVGNGP